MAENTQDEKKKTGGACGEESCGAKGGANAGQGAASAAGEAAAAASAKAGADAKAGAEGKAEAKPEAKPEEKKPTVEELQAKLKQAELKVAEHYDLYVRAMAELENTRRRSAEEVIKANKFGVEKFAKNLLPVVDSLEKALELTKDKEGDPMREGLETTYRQFIHALDVSQMKPIEAKGQPFDPHRHEAVAMVPAPEGVEPGSVVQEFRRGWMIADRVLRPSMVSVAQKK
ncbi:MAG: hypothetical protein ACFWTZ_02530 [Burkholderia sp.]|jgi:molecular chaperone GrpE